MEKNINTMAVYNKQNFKTFLYLIFELNTFLHVYLVSTSMVKN